MANFPYHTVQGFFSIPKDVIQEHILDPLDEVSFVAARSVCRGLQAVCTSREKKRGVVQFTSNYAFCVEAARQGYLGILQWFCQEKWGQGKPIVEDQNGEPIDVIAARNGHLDIVQWLEEKGNSMSYDQLLFGAAFGGHLEILLWVHKKGLFPQENFVSPDGDPLDEIIWIKAARGGSLEILQWAQKELKYTSWKKENVCSGAAGGGHLEVLQWLVAEGCSLDEELIVSAAESGSVELLQWLKSQHCPLPLGHARACQNAITFGHVEALQWLQAQGCPLPSPEKSCNDLSHLKVLMYLHSLGHHLTINTFRCVAEEGDLTTLQWLKEKDCPWDVTISNTLAAYGHLEALQWAKSVGCPVDASTATSAVEGFQYKILKWLRSEGCPLESEISIFFAQRGALEWLKWAHSKACPLDAFAYAIAAEHRYIKILRWLHSVGCPWQIRVTQILAFHGLLDELKWAISEGCPVHEYACAAAAEGGHLQVLQWLRKQKHPAPWNETVIVLAHRNNHPDIVQWAIANGCPIPRLADYEGKPVTGGGVFQRNKPFLKTELFL